MAGIAVWAVGPAADDAPMRAAGVPCLARHMRFLYRALSRDTVAIGQRGIWWGHLMSAIWAKDGALWALLQPVGFVDEAALHTLVEEAPQVLPLSGSPQLVVLGREVRIGSGSADLLAIEPSGRLVIIEVKLAKNAEARRAVVAQILAYSAFLKGTTRNELEHILLASQLPQRGFVDLVDALEQSVQDGSFEVEAFLTGLDDSLSSGVFRLVLVLDEAPPELVRLVGYLESIANTLTIDLVAVSRYEVDGKAVLVPQRVEPEREAFSPSSAPSAVKKPQGYSVRDGGADFRNSLESLDSALRSRVSRLYEWAKSLEQAGLATLGGFHGHRYVTLIPYPLGHDAGLVTVPNDGTLWVWRSVFEKRAPDSIPHIESVLAGPLKNGGTVHEVSDELLAAITEAYREARNRATLPHQ